MSRPVQRAIRSVLHRVDYRLGKAASPRRKFLKNEEAEALVRSYSAEEIDSRNQLIVPPQKRYTYIYGSPAIQSCVLRRAHRSCFRPHAASLSTGDCSDIAWPHLEVAQNIVTALVILVIRV